MPTLDVVWLGRVAYAEAWSIQARLAAARAADQIGDTLLLVEHPAVYTMGRSGSPAHVPNGVDHLRARGAEYLAVDRGGSVTFHGPGQLVAYPILAIAGVFPLSGVPGRGDVLAHLRTLEEALITTVARHGIEARRRSPYTGVWVGEDKLAAIGVKLAKGVTTHGAALNVTTDLDWFAQIVPCGISGAGVASLASLGVDPLPTLEQAGQAFATDYAFVLGRTLRRAPAVVTTLAGAAATEAPAVPS